MFVLQGGAPSPFDRNFGTKLGVRAIQWISERLTENFRQGQLRYEVIVGIIAQKVSVMIPPFFPPKGRVFANSPDTACVLGLNRKVIKFSPLTELKAVTDFE